MELQFLLILLLVFGITPNLGFFSFPSFFMLITVFIGFIALLFIPKTTQRKIPSQQLLPFASIIILFFSSFYYGGLYQEPVTLIIGTAMIAAYALSITLRWYRDHKPPSIIWAIIIYLCLSALTLIGSQKPNVDTIVVLKEAPIMAVKGLNPYVERFTSVYQGVNPTYFNYLPLSFILLIPFVYLFGDPRYSVILAMLIIAAIIYTMTEKSKKQMTASWLIVITLFLPRAFFMLEHIYLDPMIVSLFTLCIYFLSTAHPVIGYIFLALFFSIKQTSWVTVPLFLSPFLLPMIKRVKYSIAFFLPFVFPLYYYFLNPSAFTEDALVGLSKTSLTSPIHNSLTVQTFFSRIGVTLGPLDGLVLPIIILVIVYALILWKKPRLCYSIAFVVFSFHFFSYHAFFNVYYFILLLLVLDMALARDTSTQTYHL